MTGHVYFHSPCFDGICSAVLATDFLEGRAGWVACELHAVNYHLRSTWLDTHLGEPSAVVDFLFHPGSQFWADHHPTAFLTESLRTLHDARKASGYSVYDEQAGSCTGLLARHFSQRFEFGRPTWNELVAWAEKIDAARYASVQEAVYSEEPAMMINASLVMGNQNAYCERLVRSLREHTLSQVAQEPEVQRRYHDVKSRTAAGLDRLATAVSLEPSDIVVFDVDEGETMVPRYGPYVFQPNARFSAGIVRSGHRAKITAMRNPWLEFPCVNLGEICAELGGGGHQRVGSIMLDAEQTPKAREVLDRLVGEIRRRETQ